MNSDSNRRSSYFLIIIVSSTIILSIPMISGHIFYEGHLFHIAIHESGFILASFLAAMAIISYKKTKIPRMLFSASAFSVLAFGQGVYMYSKIGDHVVEDMSSPGEILDISIVVMTILFAAGVFYKR